MAPSPATGTPTDERATDERATDRDRAIERALADLVLGPQRNFDDPSAFRRWIAERNLHPDDAAALAAQDPKRLVVYRALPRFSMRGAVALAMPRSMARLGDSFHKYWDRFLNEHGPRSHYLRDVTTEFLDFCEPIWRAEQAQDGDAPVPPYLADLARHEALRVVIASQKTRQKTRAQETEAGALELGRGVRFTEAVRVMRYGFAVHELPDDEDDRSMPREAPTTLLVYRDPDHEVRYLRLTHLAGTIIDGLIAGRTLSEAVTGSCDQARQAVTDELLGGIAQVLGDLAERRVILGPN